MRLQEAAGWHFVAALVQTHIVHKTSADQRAHRVALACHPHTVRSAVRQRPDACDTRFKYDR